jgi:hypothetical protein
VRPHINPLLFMKAGLRSLGLLEVEDARKRLAGLRGEATYPSAQKRSLIPGHSTASIRGKSMVSHYTPANWSHVHFLANKVALWSS